MNRFTRFVPALAWALLAGALWQTEPASSQQAAEAAAATERVASEAPETPAVAEPTEEPAGTGEPVAPEAPPVTEAPEPLPEPDLAGMEPAVRDLLAEERKALERLIARDDADPALRADAWGEMGFVYHAHGLLNAAATCYRNAEALAPQDFRWPHSLGALERERGRLEEARDALTRTVEMVPGDLAAQVYLGDVLLALGDLEAAAATADRAYQLNDSSPAVLDMVGRVAMETGQIEEAAKLFEFAVAQVPEANRLQYQLGMAYRGLGDLEKAREHLALAGKIGVKPPDRLLEMIDEQKTGERLLLLEGRRAYNAGDFAAAAEAFQRAVDAEPESLRARVNLASALAYSGSVPQAVEELNYILEKNPQHQEALYNLGAILRASGKYPDAVEVLTRALQVNPEDDSAHYELGLAYRGLNRLQDAERELGLAVSGRPLDSQMQHTYGDILARLGRYQEARDVLFEAYRLQPEDGLLAHGLARLLAAAPDPAVRNGGVAVQLATRVVQAAPTLGHLETLAMALAEADRCAEAAEVQRQILDLPNLAPAGIAKFSVAAQRYAQGPPCRAPVDPELAAAAEAAKEASAEIATDEGATDEAATAETPQDDETSDPTEESGDP